MVMNFAHLIGLVNQALSQEAFIWFLRMTFKRNLTVDITQEIIVSVFACVYFVILRFVYFVKQQMPMTATKTRNVHTRM